MRLIVLAAIVAAIPATSIAQAGPKPATRASVLAELDADYARLDADGDGKVTKAEVEKRLSNEVAAEIAALEKRRMATFDKLDTNKDGSVSKAEFEAGTPLPKAPTPNGAPVLARFDANKDGSITKDEFRAPTLANFDTLDTNKDGTLSAAEQTPKGR